MSVDYASGLSPYDNKGEVGMPERHDTTAEMKVKVDELAHWIKSAAGSMVVITGAGISTSAGIPDFRGPKGVWTLEKLGVKPTFDVTFESAQPTVTHMALVALHDSGILTHLVSQNVDGLHLRSGYPRHAMSELHGNMFMEECDRCQTQYARESTVGTMAQRHTGRACSQVNKRGAVCRGRLRDTILEWEGSLPYVDLTLADAHCKKAKVCLTLGTSLQILPCGNMPLLTKKNGGKICIVNLQPTKQDKRADMKIHYDVDAVMTRLCELLDVRIPTWQRPFVRVLSPHPPVLTIDKDFPAFVVDAALSGSGISYDKVLKDKRKIAGSSDVKDAHVKNNEKLSAS